jgi:hypothetical protein
VAEWVLALAVWEVPKPPVDKVELLLGTLETLNKCPFYVHQRTKKSYSNQIDSIPK